MNSVWFELDFDRAFGSEKMGSAWFIMDFNHPFRVKR